MLSVVFLFFPSLSVCETVRKKDTNEMTFIDIVVSRKLTAIVLYKCVLSPPLIV